MLLTPANKANYSEFLRTSEFDAGRPSIPVPGCRRTFQSNFNQNAFCNIRQRTGFSPSRRLLPTSPQVLLTEVPFDGRGLAAKFRIHVSIFCLSSSLRWSNPLSGGCESLSLVCRRFCETGHLGPEIRIGSALASCPKPGVRSPQGTDGRKTKSKVAPTIARSCRGFSSRAALPSSTTDRAAGIRQGGARDHARSS